MRKSLFNSIKAGGKGGNPGQWSGRKAQMLAKQYKANQCFVYIASYRYTGIQI